MKKKKALCVILSIVLIFTMGIYNFSITAETNSQVVIATSSNIKQIQKTDILSETSVPETLNYSNAVYNGHIERLYHKENDLNTAIFKNIDGTNTMYIFDENIKYVDINDVVKDKSNKLFLVDNGYCNLQNDISVFYPMFIDDYITLSFDTYNISFRPMVKDKNLFKANLSTSTQRDIADSVEYVGVFGNDSKVVYTQTFSGVKEQIVLNSPVNDAKFTFEVVVTGLNLKQSENIIKLIDSKSKSDVGIISPLVLIDNNGRYGFGKYSIELSTQKNTYILTIDATEFINTPDIEYPVIIDPSISIGQSDVSAIEDATIFTDYSTNFGDWDTLFVGDYDLWFPETSSPRGIARTLIKFPGLDENNSFQSLYEDDLVYSVKYNFADVYGESGPNVINAYRITRNWDEDTVVYSSSLWNAYNSTLIGTTTVSATSYVSPPYPRYEIDITDAIDKWQSGTSNYGIMLKSSNESLEAVVLGASESGTSIGYTSSRPYVVVNYGNYRAYVNNYYDNGFLVYHGLSSTEAKSLIKEHFENVSSVYFNLLGLNLLYDSSNNKKAVYYESPIDECKGTVTTSNINTLCTHSTPCTDRGNVITAFNPDSGNNLTTNIYWTGHRIKSTATNGTTDYNRSCSYYTRIYMLNRTLSNLSAVLLHEINHQYDAVDHYHELADINDSTSCKFKEICSDCGENPRPSSCIMNSTSIDITSSSAICNLCKSEILIHLENHH